jgi:hypothetical protein
MSVQNEIESLLSESLVTRIHFSLSGLTINGGGFQRVKNYIHSGRIGVGVDNTIPAGAGASYDPDANRIGVDASLTAQTLRSSIQMRSLMLHECCHAVVDVLRASRTTILSDEAAAFIVQLYYRLGKGQGWLRSWAAGNSTPTGRIFHEAIRIVDTHRLLRTTARLQHAQYEPLRQAIGRHPVYRGTGNHARTRADGV